MKSSDGHSPKDDSTQSKGVSLSTELSPERQAVTPPSGKRSHKRLITVVVLVLLALVGVVAIWRFVLNKPVHNSVDDTEATVERPYLEGIPDYALIGDGNDDYIALVKDGDIVLERNYDIGPLVGDWLFFQSGALDDQGNRSTTGLHAVNLKTMQYKTIGEILLYAGVGRAELSILNDGYMYIFFSAYSTRSVTYRCLLDETIACGEISLFHDSEDIEGYPRQTVWYGGGNYFIKQGFGDAGYDYSKWYLHDPATRKNTEIIDMSWGPIEGKRVVTVDSNGLLWVGEFVAESGADPDNPSNDDKGVFVRLYAIDKTGKIVKTYLPKDIPLNVWGVYGGESSDIVHFLLEGRNEKIVSLNVLTGKLGEVLKSEVTPDKSEIDWLRSSIDLPAGYEFIKISR